MRFGLALISLFLVSSFSNAQSRSFPTCSGAFVARIDLDNFCPRMEGVHLEGCCPPLEKRPATQCTYHVIESAGQAYYGNSSSVQCIGGVDTAVPCCRLQQRGCYRDPVTLNFISRLIGRSNQCCFETCPPASYWRANPNPKSEITSQHVLTGGGYAQCTGTELQECTSGGGACPADSPCPPPPPDPSPAPVPNPGPTSPSPGPVPAPVPNPGPYPAPDPGPSYPSPAPEPSNPSPAPEPQPEPPSPPPTVAPPGS